MVEHFSSHLARPPIISVGGCAPGPRVFSCLLFIFLTAEIISPAEPYHGRQVTASLLCVSRRIYTRFYARLLDGHGNRPPTRPVKSTLDKPSPFARYRFHASFPFLFLSFFFFLLHLRPLFSFLLVPFPFVRSFVRSFRHEFNTIDGWLSLKVASATYASHFTLRQEIDDLWTMFGRRTGIAERQLCYEYTESSSTSTFSRNVSTSVYTRIRMYRSFPQASVDFKLAGFENTLVVYKNSKFFFKRPR